MRRFFHAVFEAKRFTIADVVVGLCALGLLIAVLVAR